MSDAIEHAVVHISVNPPLELVGFIVEGGNCLHAKETYDNAIFKDVNIVDVEEAFTIMTEAKKVMEAAGYTCGEVLKQTRADWMALLFERPLTEEERATANAPCEYEEDAHE